MISMNYVLFVWSYILDTYSTICSVERTSWPNALILASWPHLSMYLLKVSENQLKKWLEILSVKVMGSMYLAERRSRSNYVKTINHWLLICYYLEQEAAHWGWWYCQFHRETVGRVQQDWMLQEGSQKPITVIVEVNLVYTNNQTSFNYSIPLPYTLQTMALRLKHQPSSLPWSWIELATKCYLLNYN